MGFDHTLSYEKNQGIRDRRLVFENAYEKNYHYLYPIKIIVFYDTHLNCKGVRDDHDDHRYVKGNQRTKNEKSSIVDHTESRIRHNVLGVVQTCEKKTKKQLHQTYRPRKMFFPVVQSVSQEILSFAAFVKLNYR